MLILSAPAPQVVRAFTHGKSDAGTDFVACTASSSGRYLYAVAEDAVLYVFNAETGAVEHVLKMHERACLGLALHPHRNVLSSFADDGTLKIWRA